jgi:CRISPR system Cascade subunit CasA
MSFNLIHENWIPVRRQDGARALIAPWQISEKLNPVTALDAPRPDFNGALIQFLIGLVQTTAAPKNDREWRAGLTVPPSPDQLKQSFDSVAFAFNLDGDGPRFMQDLELVQGKEKEIEVLLIDAPGENTVENNIDFFKKRSLVNGMCFPCVGTALFTLQTNAPGGGQGHRTSLRGGGPLTTLVVGLNLWDTVWLNVLPSTAFPTNASRAKNVHKADIFPWLAPTRTSEKGTGVSTTPVDVDPLQMFWGMPRRIRLSFDSVPQGQCDICGNEEAPAVSRCMTKNYGVDYKGAWQHPLTPYTEIKGEPPSPRKGQPGGVHYRHWLGLVQADNEAGRRPARLIHEFWERQSKWPELHTVFRRAPRLWAFAYEMDKRQLMKARCWYESTIPLMQIPDEFRSTYEAIIGGLIRTAMHVAGNVRRCVKQALFEPRSDVRGDMSFIDARFWQTTESDFYRLLEDCRDKMRDGNDCGSLKLEWLKVLANAGERIFDELSQANQIEIANPKRIALAARDLHRLNSQTNKKVRELLDLSKTT